MIESPNFSSRDFTSASHILYARLRFEAPIYRCKLPDRQTAWLVIRYDDVLGALKDPRLVKDRQDAAVGAKQPWTPGFIEPLTRNMLDRHRFHRLSSRIVASDPSDWHMSRAVPSVVAFLRYIRCQRRRLVRARQEEPRDDLVSALVQAEEESDQLNEDELTAMIFLLLVAGHETTVNLIGNGRPTIAKPSPFFAW